MNRYKIEIGAEFNIAADDEDEAIDIVDKQVKKLNRDYFIDARVKSITRL